MALQNGDIVEYAREDSGGSLAGGLILKPGIQMTVGVYPRLDAELANLLLSRNIVKQVGTSSAEASTSESATTPSTAAITPSTAPSIGDSFGDGASVKIFNS